MLLALTSLALLLATLAALTARTSATVVRPSAMRINSSARGWPRSNVLPHIFRPGLGAKRRLADEYDAAQAREELLAGRPKTLPGGNTSATVKDVGLTSKQIHDARAMRSLLWSQYKTGLRSHIRVIQLDRLIHFPRQYVDPYDGLHCFRKRMASQR